MNSLIVFSILNSFLLKVNLLLLLFGKRMEVLTISYMTVFEMDFTKLLAFVKKRKKRKDHDNLVFHDLNYMTPFCICIYFPIKVLFDTIIYVWDIYILLIFFEYFFK